ncbi:MAG TPA: glycosyltransferase family 2 protein [Acidimicrobiia bacterium]|nr:glycosyltransferase family 2 protein [Acidimicrobiia bacterium]
MADGSVTAVVVNYRSGDDLESCLTGLLEDDGPLARVVVVDNDSEDSSWEIAKRYADDDERVEVVLSPENLGLAGAVNRVLADVSTPYVAVLNPDVTPMTGWLRPLAASLETDATAAVACPLVLIEESGMVNSAGQHIHLTGLGFNRLLYSAPEDAGTATHRVGGLHGAAFVIRTDVLRTLGGWDDSGFLYHEDVALSWDVLLLGRDILCVPVSRVLHDYHLTMYPEKMFLLERNRIALLFSHLSTARLAIVFPALVVTEIMVWGLAILRGWRFLQAKTRAYLEVWRRRGQIRQRKAVVRSRPVYDPRNLRRNVRWSYPVGQLGALGSERGESKRRPPGGLPVEPSA